MSFSAANVVPSFGHRRSITAEDLRHVEEPCVILEHHGYDSDGQDYYVFTVGGVLDGVPLLEGVTIGGEVAIVHADSPDQAKQIASDGLLTTLQGLDTEEDRYRQARAALARLRSVGPLERLDQATKPAADKSDSFVEDVDAVRPLIGDDVVLATGGVAH